jgi:hypothetical protein
MTGCGGEQESIEPEKLSDTMNNSVNETKTDNIDAEQIDNPKPTLLERATAAAEKARKPDITKTWDDVSKSGEEIWEKSKATTQDIVTLGTESTKEVWDESKEVSQEIWENSKDTSEQLWEESKESGNEIWDASKETSRALWEKSSDRIDQLFKNSEEDNDSDAYDKANEAFETNNI